MEVLEKIRNIKEVGFIFKTLNISNGELISIIDNISSIEELENFPTFIGKYLDGEILNILSEKYINNKSFLSYLNKEIIYNLPPEEFKKLKPKALESFTAEQLKNISKSTVDYFIFNNKLHYLSNDVLETLPAEKIDFSYKYSLNFVSNRPIFEVIRTQIQNLNNHNKIHCLNLETLKYIANNRYLVSEITNFSNFTLEQFKVFEKNFKYIRPEAIATIKPEYLNNLEDLSFQSFTNKQLENLNMEQLDILFKNGKTKFFSSEYIKYINADVISNLKNISIECLSDINQDVLEALNDKTLNFIAENKSNLASSELEERQPVISNDIKNILNEDDKVLNFEDTNFILNNFMKNEDYTEMSNYCFNLARKDIYKKYIKDILTKKIDIFEKDNIYNNIDKIEILKILILIEDNKIFSKNLYLKLVETIQDLSENEPRTIDGYISRTNTYSKLIQEGNFDPDFQEKIAEENLKNIKNCIKNNYSKSERNSIDSALMEIKARALMEYANVLAKKYNINPNKFKYIDSDDKKFLTEYEILYFNSVKKAMELKPNIESTVKSWATPILKMTVKGIATYFGTKVTNGNTSNIIGVAGFASIINDGVKEFDKKKYFLNPKEYHKKERNKKDGVFVKNIRKIKYGIAKIISYPFRKIGNFFVKKSKPKGFDRKDNIISVEQQSDIFKRNICIKSCNAIIEKKILEHNKIKNKLQNELIKNNKTRQSILINKYINLKKKALEIQTQRKIENLYIKYPEFRDKIGISNCFTNLKNSVNGILRGLIGSIFDINAVVDDCELVKNSLEFESFQNEIKEICKNYHMKLYEINQEECEKLSNLNSEDGENFNLLLSRQEEELKSLENYSFNVMKNCDSTEEIEIKMKAVEQKLPDNEANKVYSRLYSTYQNISREFKNMGDFGLAF